jgi:hypothetical protein
VARAGPVALLYTLATLVMTWPLPARLASEIPWDLGDSLLNCWILAWNADHLLRALGGDFGALRGFWNGNIFYPHPLALAYSEHLIAQSVQILPVYALTENPILCYNLLFLSTFVLSGLGTYLFVRAVTGNAYAAFVGGIIYAFAPYRIGQFSHIQVMTSQWMPFALYGLRRYFDAGGWRPLAGAAAALVAQNLSCGYYLLFFAPFVASYVIYEMAVRRRLNDWRAWAHVAATALVVIACTLPFLLPYLELRQHGSKPRQPGEVIEYSADVYSYLTAHGAQRAWGEVIRGYPKPEGDLFPGMLPIVLAAIAVAYEGRRAWCAAATAPLAAAWLPARAPRAIVLILAAAFVFHVLEALVIFWGGGGVWWIGPVRLRLFTFMRYVWIATAAGVLLIAASPRARALGRHFLGSPTGQATIFTMLAFWLSLGPVMQTRGRHLAQGIYAYFYQYVPGFDGLRVPARLGMVAMLFLAILAASGVVLLVRRLGRGAALAAALSLAFLVEATSAPIFMNGTGEEQGLQRPPNRVPIGAQAPPVYHAVARLPDDAVIVEFPFGPIGYEVRYMFYSTLHWRPLVNGYSGGFPAGYVKLVGAFIRLPENRDEAWTALSRSGATHAIVHQSAYLEGQGQEVAHWLERRRARRIGDFGADVLFELPIRKRDRRDR